MFRQALKAARRARAQAFRHSLAQRRGDANANRGTSCAASALGACRDGRSTAASSARSYVAASAAANNSLYGSMLVERIPVVIPEAPAWEREYKEWSEARRDKFRVKLPDQIVEAKGLLDNLPDFEPAPRETEADRTGDRSTLHRKLPEFLFLVVKEKDGKWGFPKSKHDDGETMRQTAERSLKAFAGDSLECWVVGNAPQGHYETADGTTFYYRGSYIEGELELQDGYVEHAWVTKEELGEYFDADHHDLLKRML